MATKRGTSLMDVPLRIYSGNLMLIYCDLWGKVSKLLSIGPFWIFWKRNFFSKKSFFELVVLHSLVLTRLCSSSKRWIILRKFFTLDVSSKNVPNHCPLNFTLTRLTWLIHTSVLPSNWNLGKIFALTV